MVYRDRRLQGILWSPAMYREKCCTKAIHTAMFIDRQYNIHYTMVITIAGKRIFDEIIAAASGKITKAERFGQRDFSIFKMNVNI
jgi:altronate dehydratase